MHMKVTKCMNITTYMTTIVIMSTNITMIMNMTTPGCTLTVLLTAMTMNLFTKKNLAVVDIIMITNTIMTMNIITSTIHTIITMNTGTCMT